MFKTFFYNDCFLINQFFLVSLSLTGLPLTGGQMLPGAAKPFKGGIAMSFAAVLPYEESKVLITCCPMALERFWTAVLLEAS